MTGNASYQHQHQQLGGVDAMMSGCFVSGGADTPAFHDGSSFVFAKPADVAGSFFIDGGGSMLAAGQLQLIRAAAPPPGVSPEQTRGGTYGVSGYGPSPSDDVTVAHAPYHCSSTWFVSGDDGGFRDPFAAAAASELSLRLPAPLEPFSLPAGALNVSLTDQSSSEVSCSGLTHASSSAGVFRPSCGGGEMAARPPGPLHFSQVLSRWPGYSHIAQDTLDEFVGCLLQDVAGFAGEVGGGGEASCPMPMSSCSNTTSSDPSVFLGSEEHAHHKLKNDLQKLLQLLDQGCNQWMDEIQSAACKYGGMVRPGTGVLLAAFANRAVSAMHRRLRARITGEIAAAAAASRRRGSPSQSPAVTLADRERSWESAFIQKHWALRQLRRGDQQSWRPQRGLPEKSVAVLKAWMFENFLRPYPKDNEKEMLAVRSGLSRSQVSNWFINARVRLWKPMIEEMYDDLKKASGGGDGVVA
ncbi:hypothetical protein HU200_064870 [Digitaria exilis]|uniref:Homeobox domain-containing protein n=1 Tax=Digitaria exilis TaxID=1010633 RepID=A0A835A3H7_9POAL|nr:hypothetical protein HU200_064870 [Digitaria exilis]CAB3468206.1 unnamed protein product [Digitaria exilis]